MIQMKAVSSVPFRGLVHMDDPTGQKLTARQLVNLARELARDAQSKMGSAPQGVDTNTAPVQFTGVSLEGSRQR